MENKRVFKNHPLSIFLNNKSGTFALIFTSNVLIDIVKDILKGKSLNIFIKNFKTKLQEDPYITFIFIGIFCLIFLSLFYEFLIYKNTSITIDDKNIYYKKNGIFVKKYKTTLIKNISNINIQNSIFQKLFDLVSISIDTDSTETVKKSDYKLIVKNSDAILMKNLINSLKTENNDYIFEKDIDEINENYIVHRFTTREVFRHILISTSPLLLLFQISTVIFPFLFDSTLGNSILFVISLSFVYFVIFISNQLNKVNNLTITRKENEIDIFYGFLRNEHFSIPISKIQSLDSEQSFFARLFNYKIYKINAVGVGNEKDESNILNVYLKTDIADKNLKEILPEFEIENKFTSQNINYIKYLSSINLFLAFIYTIFLVYLGYWWISLILDVFLILATTLQMKYNYISILKDRVIVKRGFFSVITKTIYYEKIDTVTIHQNILSKIFKIQKLKITFRGKIGKDQIQTGYFKEGFFDKIIEFYRNGEKN